MRCYTSLLRFMENQENDTTASSPVHLEELANLLLYDGWRFFDEHLDVNRVFRMSYLQERGEFPIAEEVRHLCHIDMSQVGQVC